MCFYPILANATPLAKQEELFKRNKRIVGGEYVNIESQPWLASIQRGGYHKCVGSIISEYTILTTASCVDECLQQPMIVRVGSSRTDSGGMWHRVIAVKKHEKYIQDMKSFVKISNNVALIKVSPPFEFGKNVAKIQLADIGRKVDQGTIVSIAGWGSVSSKGTPIIELKGTNLLVTNSSDCARAYGDSTGTQIRLNKQFCASADDSGFCYSDIGAPLVEQKTQIGIASWSIGCADSRYSGVYTEVAEYREWIDLHSQIMELSNYEEKRMSTVCPTIIKSASDKSYAIPSVFGQ